MNIPTVLTPLRELDDGTENPLYPAKDGSESCPSGLEGAGRKRAQQCVTCRPSALCKESGELWFIFRKSGHAFRTFKFGYDHGLHNNWFQ